MPSTTPIVLPSFVLESEPSFPSPSDASHLYVPLQGEKTLPVAPTEIDSSFDVPVDGQKRLMTQVSDVEADFDVPLDGQVKCRRRTTSAHLYKLGSKKYA